MSSPYQSPNEYQPAPGRRILPLLLSGCAVAGLLMVIACAGVMYLGFRQVSGQGEIALEVEGLFEAIAQGKAAEFYRAQSSAELKQATSEQKFVQFCQNINDRLGKLQSKTATGVSVRNQNLTNYVDAVYGCQFEHGKATVKTKFKRENERWLLHAFNVESPDLSKATAQKKCPNCGELYESGAKFCPHCGKELSD